MKHIFKKLHHHPNRSNETPQQSSTTSSSSSSSSSSCAVSDQRTSASVQNSGASPVSPSTTSASSATVAPASSPAPTRQQQQQPDYITSEEEYQVQLALALSVSASSGQDSSNIDVNSDQHQILSASQQDDVDADFQSRQYWDYGVLDYSETIKDGFYDVYSKNAAIKEMPSLTDLETNTEGSDFEVVIVNCKIDPGLEELMDIARCIAIDCPTTEISLLVQRLAELVTNQMGGPVRDATVLKARWKERSSELRTSRHTTVLPIGTLQIGLTRHRALLFKVLADKVGIPCRLLRGRHYVGTEDDAVNVIKLPNESEFLVDLMGEPGTLIPADIQSAKDASFKTYHPKLSKLPSLQAINDSRVTYSKPNSLSEQNSGGGNSVSSSKESEKVESLPSISGASMSAGVSSSLFNKRVPPANQMDHTPSLAIGSSLYKGGRGPNVAGNGARVNVNPVPYNQNNSEDPKYLFADLNPFQVKGSGRASLQGNHAGKKVDESHQAKDNLVTGRPPVPLLWKNPHVYNEVPKKNEYDFVESLFSKNDHPAVGCNVPSIPSTSSAAPGKASSEVFKLPNKSDNAYGGYGGNASAGNNSLVASAEGAFNRLSLEDNQSIHHRETYNWDWEILQNDESNLTKDYGKNVSGMLDHINSKQDGLVGTNLKLKDQENPSSSAEPHADPVIDDVSDCEIPWEDLVIGERIGLGSYGEVYRADWNGTEVAVKKFLDQDFSGAALAEFKREVRIMQRLRHPNVVLFMGAVTRPPHLSIITEFLPRGSLYRIIHRPHCQIDEKRRIKMALDVAKGMNGLHTSIPTIVHRDLKSPNLLVDNNWNVKVGDFGLSRLKHNTFLSSKSTAGTPEWMAPEVLRNEPSNEKCDVYSFGVILWELATLKLPWSGMNPMQVVGAVGFQNRRLDISKEVDPLVARIIWQCWQTDPNLRPSFSQLTVALKPLQRLVIPSHVEQPSTPLPQEISVNSTP